MFYDATWLDAAGRWLIIASFLVAGLCNLTRPQIKSHIERLGGFRVPWPAGAFWFGMAMQFTGIALLITGWYADLGAVCLIAFTVAATLIYHRFWTKKDPMQRTISRLTMTANTAIVGGLLLLFQNLH